MKQYKLYIYKHLLILRQNITLYNFIEEGTYVNNTKHSFRAGKQNCTSQFNFKLSKIKALELIIHLVIYNKKSIQCVQ